MPNDPYSRDTSPNSSSGRAEDAHVGAAWSDLQRDLDTLGRQLNELRNHSATLGEDPTAVLERAADAAELLMNCGRFGERRRDLAGVLGSGCVLRVLSGSITQT